MEPTERERKIIHAVAGWMVQRGSGLADALRIEGTTSQTDFLAALRPLLRDRLDIAMEKSRKLQSLRDGSPIAFRLWTNWSGAIFDCDEKTLGGFLSEEDESGLLCTLDRLIAEQTPNIELAEPAQPSELDRARALAVAWENEARQLQARIDEIRKVADGRDV